MNIVLEGALSAISLIVNTTLILFAIGCIVAVVIVVNEADDFNMGDQ